MGQPIIRGIQAVGGVDILYTYNGKNNELALPTSIKLNKNTGEANNNTKLKLKAVKVAGFRLDGEFLRAVQQIASSVVIPILGGGGIALTNNNRTGTLNINATKVSTPDGTSTTALGSMYTPTGSAIGVVGNDTVYDLVFLAQAQQAVPGGDSVGSTISVVFDFCQQRTVITFEGCTIASVDPIGLSGNDAVNYNVSINYLNWSIEYNKASGTDTTQSSPGEAGNKDNTTGGNPDPSKG